MNLADMKTAVLLLVVIALVASAGALALDEFNDDLTADSFADNATDNGLEGIDNTTSFLDTIGTIIAVTVLVGIVVSAFAFGKR